MLTKGTVKVLRVDEWGNELFLYHILAGESCAVSLASSLTDKPSHIKAVAEEMTELIAIPASLSIEWYRKYQTKKEQKLSTSALLCLNDFGERNAT